MPWQLNQPFVGSDGNVYTPFADPSSPTGYSVRHSDQYGTDVQPITPPVNPSAAQDYWANTPYGARIAAAEAAQAAQNAWNQRFQYDQLGVSKQNAQTQLMSARAQIEQAKQDLELRRQQEAHSYEMQRGNLGLNTMQLGASLHGPRQWDQYLRTAAAAGQNPILQGALGTWSSLTNVRPNTGAMGGPLPQRFDLNALSGDFMGGVGQSQANQRNADLDRVAMGGAPAPGWWQGLSGSEQERAKGYWENNGWDPNSVLNSLSYTATNQGLGYSGA
jgi:hypothetical protein